MRLSGTVGKLATGLLAVMLVTFSSPVLCAFYGLAEVEPLWVKTDLNGDGYVTEDEVCAEDPRLVPGFRQADHNRDGKLDLREFEVLLISL